MEVQWYLYIIRCCPSSQERWRGLMNLLKLTKWETKFIFYLLNFTFLELNSYFSTLHSGHDLSSILLQPIGVDVRQSFPSLKFIFPGTIPTPWQFTFSYSITLSQGACWLYPPSAFCGFYHPWHPSRWLDLFNLAHWPSTHAAWVHILSSSPPLQQQISFRITI